MPKCYTYTVTSKITGEVITKGSLEKCATATGLHVETLRSMATNPRNIYITSARRKYAVTREPGREEPLYNSKYYSVYDKKTDELAACGTSKECAKTLGWKSPDIFHNIMAREKRTGRTRYEFYSEPYYENIEEDMV